ncbi:hypothetical protein HH195_10955 [Sarcina sp. JB2]|uniref:Uncharacterized protein n=1 Tax=Candidatus Sarcina troglodytae TaxID=2726954 RepID=A0ACD1BFX5_9CLOT|nr:hypothetical protein HH195_10955 [Sarcina sp. JB2]
MYKKYKVFGETKQYFHMNGQQPVEFQDDTSATGESGIDKLNNVILSK